MKLEEIYRTAVKAGRDADPRGNERIEKDLAAAQKEYDELKEKDREFFDLVRLKNPYADTRILHGAPDVEVRSLLVGIDMEAGELVLADRLRERRGLDLVLTHHPEGRALAKRGDVMGMQADILHQMGVPIATAEGILADRIREVSRRLLPVNHTRAVDAARLLDLPFMCVHTPGDNLVTTFLQKMLDERRPETVGEVVDLLLEIPEYRHGASLGVGPKVVAGAAHNRAGRAMEKHISGVPVVDKEGQVIGIVTEIDLIKRHAQVHMPVYIPFLDSPIFLEDPRRYQEDVRRVLGTTAEEIMTRRVHTATPETSVEDIATLMVDERANPIPIVDSQGALVGIVTHTDIVHLVERAEAGEIDAEE